MFGFSRLSLAIGSRVEAPVMSFTQNVWLLLLWLTHKWNFQSRKTLRQIFKIFSHRFLVTCTGDLFATHSSCERHVFYALGVFFKTILKNFLVFPHIMWMFIVSLFKLIVFTLKNSVFLHHLFTNIQEKVWVIYFSQSISCFQPLISWIVCFVESWKICCSNTIWVYFVKFDEWVLLVLIVWCLLYIFSCLLLILE